MEDPEFRTLANELVDLRRSPETSPQALRAAEEALACRAAEVAAAKLRATEEVQARYPFLSKRVAGVPLSEQCRWRRTSCSRNWWRSARRCCGSRR
ncbi:hypothetical protein LSCM1_06869 [Leishmania martiniquensis]|uniref:DUF7623 domain-containing protein n=1 Tax=Leishmania martiniquensis TaxID=1580590 RepID=A0A836HB04_9TRYP|nr:hypothetical protein LSCM1_06869 [Leishmania martiniquensis]